MVCVSFRISMYNPFTSTPLQCFINSCNMQCNSSKYYKIFSGPSGPFSQLCVTIRSVF